MPAAGDEELSYARACACTFGVLHPRPPRLFRIPFLGVEPSVLPEEAIPLLVQPSVAVSSAHDRVVAALAQACAPLEYAPQVPSLSLILLHQLRWSEARTFCAVRALTRQSQAALAALLARPAPASAAGESVGDGVPALALSRGAETAFVRAFRTILKSASAPLSAHCEARPPQPAVAREAGAPAATQRTVKSLVCDMFAGCFSGFLPTRDVGRLVRR